MAQRNVTIVTPSTDKRCSISGGKCRKNNPEVQRAPVVQVTNMAAEDDSDIPGSKKNSFLQQIEAVSSMICSKLIGNNEIFSTTKDQGYF